MILWWPTLVYLLCLAASTLCAALLFRAWRQSRSRLLLWTAISFLFFAFNNLALVADMIIFVETPLWPLRLATQLVAFAVLLYGFVWEAER